jgi:glutathionylspermidine synthase
MLHPDLRDGWARYLEVAGDDALEDIASFKAAIHREQFPHLFPPPVFEDRFVTEMIEDTRQLLRLLYSLPDRIFDGDYQAWMTFLGLPDSERSLLSDLLSPRTLRLARQFARPDFVVTADGLKLVEVNVSPPLGGLNTHDPYARQFEKSGYQSFLSGQGFTVTAPSMTTLWGDALREVTRTTAGDGRPVMYEAIANPADINSGRHAFEQLVHENGYDYANGLVQDLQIRGDGVFSGDRRIHAIFAMYTWKETREFVDPGVTRALAAADEAGLVDFIAAPAYALFDNKANLELLSSPAYATFFTDDERALIRRYVPETFRVTPATGDSLLAEKDDFVLKPASEYGGRGILFGDQLSEQDWADAVNTVAADGGYVAQRRLAKLWRCSGFDGEGYRDYHVVLGPLVFGDRYGGTFVRWTDVAGRNLLVNVHNGAEAGALLSA